MACRKKILYLPKTKPGCCVPMICLVQIAEEGRKRKGSLSLIKGGALMLGVILTTTICVASF